MDKTVRSLEEAVADVFDGATVAVGGFLGSGTPHNLLAALARHGAKDLTVIGNGGSEWWPLVENRQVSRLVSSFGIYRRRPESTPFIAELLDRGALEIEIVPAGILEERMRAGGAGIGALYREAAEGTAFDEGKGRRSFNGKPYVLEEALHVDFALAMAWRADRWGNVACRLGAGNRNIWMAQAAKQAIFEVEQAVELGELDPNRIDVPGVFVSKIVQAPKVIKWAKDEPGIAAKAGRPPSPLPGLTRELIGLRAARELRDGMHVNLGIGIPVFTCNFIPEGVEIVLHSEQGVLGYGPEAVDESDWDYDLINASGRPLTLLPGASCFDFGTSFQMTRGGKLDMSILGAFEVSEKGDLANWVRPGEKAGGVGGAMELAMGARRVIATLEHTDPTGRSRIVRTCALPITAPRAVDTIITNLAVIDVTQNGLVLREVAPGVTVHDVCAATEASVAVGEDIREMSL